MNGSRVIVCLPTANLRAAYQFYRDVGLRTVAGEGDEMPEPVEFVLNDGVHLMVIPRGGFGWVAGGNEVAPRGSSECILSLTARSEEEVDALVGRVRAAGGEIAADPARESWGYSATFKDLDGHVWMVVHSQ
jgi:uncharacterized protein